MSEESGPYWTNVSLESEEMEQRLWASVQECENVRLWAVGELRKRWYADKGTPTTSELVPEMTKLVRKLGYQSQRFTLISALNKMVTDFNKGIEVRQVGNDGSVVKVYFPNEKVDLQHFQIQIQSRSIWRKYLDLYGRLSTHYGSLFLEEGWEKVRTEQAKAFGVEEELFPYLWYSITLRAIKGEGSQWQWQVRFNLHKPTSKVGKKLIREKEPVKKWA